MTKEQYLESQRGQPYSVIVANQPMVNIVGSIRGDNLRNVVAILAGGLQYRLDNAPDSPIRTALLTAFKYMMLPDYAINLSLAENIGLLQMAVTENLVTSAEYAQFVALATYQKPEFDITVADCVEYFGGSGWIELPATSNQTLTLRLHSKAPEQTHIVVQMKEEYSDGSESDWYHATALHGIELAREYKCALPYNGYPRKLRYRCDYVLDAALGA